MRFYKDLSKDETEFTPIVAEISNDSFGVIDNVGDKFLVRTNRNGPNGRVVLVDPRNPQEKNWRTIFAGEGDPLPGRRDGWWQALCFMAQGCRHARVCVSLDGVLENEITLPGLGTAVLW